jgi:hypothetical protein
MRNTVLGLAAAFSTFVTVGAGATPNPAVQRHGALPAGDAMVLYRQAYGAQYINALATQNTTSGSEALAADDFTISSPAGWTIAAFDFAVAFANDTPDLQPTWNVRVFADAAGAPNEGIAPLCEAENAGGMYDAVSGTVTVPLPQACQLPPGTYWLAFQANLDIDASQPFAPSMYWQGYTAQPRPGHGAMWKNPTDDYGTGCTAWSAPADCRSPLDTLGFGVLGYAGGGAGDTVSLALTVAPDNGDPAQCGTATSIRASAGDKVNLCYTITNHSGAALDYQTLGDTAVGSLFALQNRPLPAGASFRVNRTIVVETRDRGVLRATLSAQNRLPGYGYTDGGASRFVEISGTGTRLDLGNDSSTYVDMPFSFDYYGTTTNLLGVSANGGLFVGAVRPLDFLNHALPTTAFSMPAMLPLWDDFETTSGGVYTAVLGDAPNRRFVVEWSNVVHYNSGENTDGATFEVIIDEATGGFSFEYADVDYTAFGGYPDPDSCNRGVCATIGVQKDDTLSTQYSFTSASVANGKSIVWGPAAVDDAYTTSAAVTFDVGAPQITVAPGALNVGAVAGSTKTARLTVGNTGDRDLAWNIDAGADLADSRAHFPAVAYRAPHASAAELALLDEGVRATRKPNAGGTLPPLRAALDAADIPAFALAGDGPAGPIGAVWLSWFSLDAAAPDTMLRINSMPFFSYVGGAFANNDFSKEYLATMYGGFQSIDVATGVTTPIGATDTQGIRITDLAWDAATQTMYATAWDPVNPTISYLYTVDLDTGTMTRAARIDGIVLVSGTFDATGHLYGLDSLGSQLVAIDKRNGDWRGIGPLGVAVSNIGSIDFDPRSGVIWYAGHPRVPHIGALPEPAIWTLNPANGRANMVGPVVLGYDLFAFALAVPYAGCTAPADVPWLTFDATSGMNAAGELAPLVATFDATRVTPGVYEANICVRSNDLANRIVGVPVKFTVTVNETIFASGFDD